MKTVGTINIIENFISNDTCKFLIRSYSNSFNETPNKGIYGGPSTSIDHAWDVRPGNAFPPYQIDPYKNICSDLITNISWSMSRVMSEQYKKDLDMRTFFFSKMVEGAALNEHYDNYENSGREFNPYGTNPKVMEKIGFESDYSSLLYLNNEYEGGEIEFPQYDLKLKPKPGTFIFFKGDMDAFHKVNEVISGERYNLVSFFWGRDYRKKYFEELANLND